LSRIPEKAKVIHVCSPTFSRLGIRNTGPRTVFFFFYFLKKFVQAFYLFHLEYSGLKFFAMGLIKIFLPNLKTRWRLRLYYIIDWLVTSEFSSISSVVSMTSENLLQQKPILINLIYKNKLIYTSFTHYCKFKKI
jgi:hypothetical protein